MDNILITGADGQLGSELRSLLERNKDYQCFFTDVSQLDITDQDAVDSFVSEHSIKKIINCAAYNNVDGAETDADAAIKINVTGPMCLATSASRHGIYLIHISTDFVFDGKKRTPYHESDRPSPLSEYGRTKLAGELAVKRDKTGRRAGRQEIRMPVHHHPHGMAVLAVRQEELRQDHD